MKYHVEDSFVEPEVLEQVLAEWPEEGWECKECETSIKKHISNPSLFGPYTLNLIRQLNSPKFVSWIEQITGIENLHPDPFLEGAGLHHIDPGGFLNIHVDFNYHKKINMVRRVNLLLYLNKEPEGGELELIDGEDTIVIDPIFNRCVIFNTNEDSWRGHPNPTKIERKSIALYYYSPGEVEPHTTIYR